MPSSFKILLLAALFLWCKPAGYAQDNDYLKHGKIFCLCSFKLECSNCRSCEKQRYAVKIDNHAGKKIKHVFYKFYSPVFNTILEREAKIDADEIRKNETGIIHICVLEGDHWIISKIVYDDESSNIFVLHDRMESFRQDADECDCND